MTSRELLDEILAQGPRSDALALECRIIFRILVDNLYRAQLSEGGLLRDISDVRAFLQELVDELAPHQKPAASVGPRLTLRQEQPRWKPDLVCPHCRHTHEGRDECKVYLGEGKFCLCEEKVTA